MTMPREQVTLGTTTLLHESYIRLADREGLRFPDRARFMAYAAKALRGLMIDYVRARRARKRGGEFQIVRMGDEEFPAPDSVADDQRPERLAHALADLEKLDPRLAELVDLHSFGGFSFTESRGFTSARHARCSGTGGRRDCSSSDC